MKRNLFISLVILMIVGCSNDEQTTPTPKEVTVNIDYVFWENGSMTKSGNDIYTEFYDKYIKTKQVTPSRYALSFKNKETNASLSMTGKWKNKDAIKLLNGEYEIIGTSYPDYGYSSEFKLDTLYMSFNENITIDDKTTNIALTAKHDSYMLIFNKTNIKSIEYYIQSPSERFQPGSVDNIYYMFINHLYGGLTNILKIERKDGTSLTLDLENIPFEKGKYYYFDDITSSFDIPPMQEGN